VSTLTIHAEVRAALTAGTPVVALESTVIAHGLPQPHNLTLARDLERIVREEGAVPATVAALDGRMRVGLEDGELARLATGHARKVSRRDWPVVLARGLDGATTVGGTMIAAHAAGIRVLATGGIGGVHRGDHRDISADLPELARTPMVVVCSGAKAILDLAATLEWLETHGIPVIGFETDEFPAFYSRATGLPVDARADSAEEAAGIARAAREHGLTRAVLVAVPCPPEAALPAGEVDEAVTVALAEAERQDIRGKAVTPFLLAEVARRTAGRSLAANLALLRRNAAVAARIAVALGP
jgi:pseudouridine-5'-phosphate glycosidase